MIQVKSPPVQLLPARLEHLDELVAIENRCFQIDRMSRRSFKHMIQVGVCDFIVAKQAQHLIGYVLVLYHRGTQLARIYSLAVLPESRGLGVGEKLIVEAEQLAVKRLCIYMRLEVHPNNHGAIALYLKHHYRQFGVVRDYYEDHADALRFQKRILYQNDRSHLINIPYHAQSTDFTCGPASLMMALDYLDAQTVPSRTLELQLWREATTIFMTSGPAGCSPLGLALAAQRRRLKVELYINTDQPLFIDGVRNPEKKEVMQLAHYDFLEQIKQTDIELIYTDMTLADLERVIRRGGVAIVLLSSYPFTRSKAPHWIVLSGADDNFFYIHDPEVDEDSFRSATDNMYLPISRETFQRAFRYGASGLKTALAVFARN